jgi:formylglycine-generating enzyme required for sulfatase activity
MGNQMIRKTAILFFIVFLHGLCRAQDSLQHNKPLDSTIAGNINPAFDASMIIAGDTTPNFLQRVLFATNEDCQLFVNGEVRGFLSKEAFLYIRLAPGAYQYVAKHPTTGDEWKDTFSIAPGKQNEVFIDFMYAMDLAKEKRARVSGASPPVAGSSASASVTASKNKADQPLSVGEKAMAAINTIIAAMIPLNGGSFVMGNNKSPSGDETEHTVVLRSFRISRYEVTQEQWEAVMGSNPSLHTGCKTCPVENVSWEEVMIFIRKINSLSGKTFRLPTEAEWEYVAKFGGKEEIEKAGGAEEYIKKTAWASVNSGNQSQPIGKKQPNTVGIYDLTGNVSEWCFDWYDALFYKQEFTDKNPQGPPLGKDKVIRGGNYRDYIGDRFRPSFRNKMNPKSKSSEVGFRLVMGGGD